MQRREAVGIAVQHVELVGEFVQHDVDPFALAAGGDIGERQHQGTAMPGLPGQDVARVMDHAYVVHFFTIAQKFVWVKNDFVPAAVARFVQVERQ